MSFDSDFENSDSIYTDEEYQKITGGKYGKEIFVPNNDSEIELELGEILKKEGIVEKFVKNLKDNSVKLILNSTYQPTVSINVPIDIIKSKKTDRKSFVNRFKKELQTSRVEFGHILLIVSALNSNFDLICNNSSTTTTEDEINNENNTEFELMVQKLLEENPSVSFEEWSIKLLYLTIQMMRI